jgi:hypothetical protein
MEGLRATHREMASKSQETRANGLQRLRELVAPYDPTSLAAGLAGLTILPENAGFQLRLESMIDVVGSQRSTSVRTISDHKFRSLCTGRLGYELVAPLEDPPEYPALETLVLEGHAYRVFTGQGEEVVFHCEHLFNALADLHEDQPSVPLAKALDLVRTALLLADAVAERAQVPEDRPLGDVIHVPERPIDEIAAPIVWAGADIDELARKANAEVSALEPLIVSMGEVAARSWGDDGRATFTPLIRCHDGRFIVRPGQILQALGRHLVELVFALGLGSEVGRRFAASVHQAVWEAAVHLGAEPQPSPFDASGVPGLFEDLFEIDDNAAMILVTLCDLLDAPTSEDRAEWFPTRRLEEQLGRRYEALVTQLRETKSHDDILLCLVPAIPPARPFRIREADLEDSAESIFLTPASIEVIAFHENDPLVLLRFAKSFRELRQKAHVISFNPLDAFAGFRFYDHTFYIDDNPRPELVSIEPGTGRRLRTEMLAKQRRQSGRPPQSTNEVEVVSASAEGLPIFMPREPWGQPARMVRLPGLDVWIAGAPFSLVPSEVAAFSLRLTDAIAYWIWRVANAMFDGRAPRAGENAQVELYIELEDGAAWREIVPSREEDDLDFAIRPQSREINLIIRPSWQGAIASPDNEGERHLAWNIAVALMTLFEPDQMSRERLTEVVERAAPQGRRKMLVTMETNTASLLGPDAGVPEWRKVSDWERGRIRDDLADAYRKAGFLPGSLGSRSDQNKLLQFAVSFFMKAFVSAVAELSPEGLIEKLMRGQEGLLLANARQELLIPTRIASFADVADVYSAIPEDAMELSQASIAHRFLMEYVAARPPVGTRPLSKAAYDHLLALASGIAEYGSQSDITFYGLDDVQAHILPSGRLGIAPGRYFESAARWNAGMTMRQIGWAGERFDEHWEKPPEEPLPPPEGWDEAFGAEFGYSASDLRAVMEELADLAADGDGSVVTWGRDTLMAELSRRIRRPSADIEPAVRSLTLAARADFLEPDGVAKEEVYPWRFGRQLSTLRKPLVARGDELIWGRRGIAFASRYLVIQIGSDRLVARSAQMRALKSKLSTRRGTEFEAEVAALAQACGLIVRRRVRKLGGSRLADNGQDLGDIDVLAADLERKILWAIECKALNAARTPWELASELKDFSDPDSGIPARHGRRLDWIRGHRAELAATLGLDLHGWRIEPLIVVEVDLLTMHLRPVTMPIVDLAVLEAVLKPRSRPEEQQASNHSKRSSTAEGRRVRTTQSQLRRQRSYVRRPNRLGG